MRAKRFWAEYLGTAGLLIVVVGSGIMGDSLSQGNAAIALLANSLATGAGLYALIQTFGPISGAHFNPVVSLVEYFWKRLSLRDLVLYASVQTVGAVSGVALAHFIFGQRLFQLSMHSRGGDRFAISEVLATFGLILVIGLSGKKRPEAVPSAVALYVTAAYWCTSSTAFANPAVTIARSFTDTFSGILWTDAPAFLVAQAVGGALAYLASQYLEEGAV